MDSPPRHGVGRNTPTMRIRLRILLAAAVAILAGAARRANCQTGYFGVAEININPTTPIMLSGYASRAGGPEATDVELDIGAQAAAFGTGADTALLLTVDTTGLTRNVTDEVASRLTASYGIPRERIVIACTHSHSSPQSAGYLGNLFAPVGGLTPTQQQHVDQYTGELIDKLEAVAVEALDARTPGHQILEGQGSVDFAANRRGTAIAPVDHDLPVLRIVDADGNTSSIITSYASHATTLNPSDNLVSGDWPGYARQSIEQLYPGAVAMVMIGAAGDANPSPLGATAYAQDHGQEVANEVQRLVSQNQFQPVAFSISAQQSTLQLDHATQLQPGDPASARLAPAPAQLPYGITSWSFGNDLAMVFMEGEVTVDYSLRLKSDLGDDRLWVNGYSNAVQGYIPSERVLYEGGYEADDSTYWYALPGRLAHGLEDKIVGQVESQLGPFFNPQDRLTLHVDRATGELSLRNDWQQPIVFDAYTLASPGGNLNPQQGSWQSLADQQLPGWSEADDSNATRLTEFNATGSLTLAPGAYVSLGKAYQNVVPTALGQTVTVGGDLGFQYSSDGQDSIKGNVEFTSLDIKNNLVLSIDPATGQTTLQNESIFFNATIDAYTITSASGLLRPANGAWNSLHDQNLGDWDEADNSNANRVTEFDPLGATFLGGGGTILSLGGLVDVSGGPLSPGDFTLHFTLSDGTELDGIITIGALPTPGLAGDVNFDEAVNIFDINLISSHWGGTGPQADANHDGVVNIFDINVVSSNWGATAAATPVPEPDSARMLLWGALLASGVCWLRLDGMGGRILRRIHVRDFQWNLEPLT
jgi:Neutral/alkaline non-lysosomal ceramidase, N-terminal/Dockerin type I domain